MKNINAGSDDITCLAVDLGGTKILVGEVDERGNVLSSKKYNSVVDNQELALQSVIDAIDNYMETVGFVSHNIAAIGMGMVGRVDNVNGLWLQIDPERTKPIPVTKILFEYFNIPCAIDNDVHCAATAENKFGWGKISQNYIYINVGTGIAAGFVVNGELLRGASFNAGEIGHHVVYRDSDAECECGRFGCVEAIASGLGMDKRARKLKSKYNTSLLNIRDDRRCDIYEIFDLADKGDPLCTLLTDDAADAIANTIMNLIRVSDPDTVVLGGGVVSGGWLLRKIMSKLNARTMRFVKNGLVLTELNPNNIGLIGAGVIGLQNYKKGDGKL